MMQTESTTPFTTNESTGSAHGPVRTYDLGVIEHLMAGGNLLAAQMPSACEWTAEKRLAAAVLASALVEIRDHYGEPPYRRRLNEDLEWIHSDDEVWPFSFNRLCAVFELDTHWVREVVARWMATPKVERDRPGTPHRQAA